MPVTLTKTTVQPAQITNGAFATGLIGWTASGALNVGGTGYFGGAAGGTLEQSVSVSAGCDQTLTWDVAIIGGGGVGLIQADILIGATVIATLTSGAGAQTLTVAPAITPVIVRFTDVSTGSLGSQDISIDNVALTSACGSAYALNAPIVSTVTATNTGTTVERWVTVVDDLLAGVTRTFTAVQTGGATGFTPAGTFTINDTMTLPAGAAVTYTINDTPRVQGSTYSNTALSNVAPAAVGVANVVVGPPTAPNVTITKVNVTSSPVGTPSVIHTRVTVRNTGSTAAGVAIADSIPLAFAGSTRTFTSVATGGATGNTAAGTIALVDTVTIPQGATITYDVFDRVVTPGIFVGAATAGAVTAQAGAIEVTNEARTCC